MFTPTNRRARGFTWISTTMRSAYIDLDNPKAPAVAVVRRDGDGFRIEIRGKEVERFVPPMRRRAQSQAEARALELLGN